MILLHALNVWFLLHTASIGNTQFLDPVPHKLDVEWPSCEELRIMWLNLRSIAIQGELTNEIPLIPTDIMNRFHPHKSPQKYHKAGRHKPSLKGYSFENIQELNSPINPAFTDGNFIEEVIPAVQVLLPPRQSSAATKEKIPLTLEGLFENFDSPDSDKAAFLPVDQSFFDHGQRSEISAFSNLNKISGSRNPQMGHISSFEPQRGFEEDVGSFGRFSNEDEITARNKASIRAAKPDVIGWHDVLKKPGVRILPTRKQNSAKVNCDEISRRECSTNDHCLCNGWVTSTCVAGRCHPISGSVAGDLKDVGAWHSGPLSLGEIGRMKRRRRIN